MLLSGIESEPLSQMPRTFKCTPVTVDVYVNFKIYFILIELINEVNIFT